MGLGEQASAFRDDARNRFLAQIRKSARTVLDDLAGEPLEAFRSVAALVPRDEGSVLWRLRPELHPLREALDRWCARYHLTAPWCFETALETLRLWDVAPDLAERREWAWCHSGWMVPGSLEGPEGWTPHGDESAEDALRRLAAWHEAQRAELRKKAEAARDAGLPVGHSQHSDETVERTVRFQVLSESFSRIAEGDSL